MKHIQHIIIISAALISLASAAWASTYTNAWDVDLVRNPPVLCDVWRGESIALTARTGLRSLPAAAEFYWQSPDMGDAWWSTNAVASATGDITVDWGPAMDSNASAYLFFFRAGNIYRPRGTIKMHGSPGAIPNELAPPVRTIDYDLVTVLNPPWATPDDVANAIDNIDEYDPVATPIAQQALDKANSITLAGLGGLTNTAPTVHTRLRVEGTSPYLALIDTDSPMGNHLEFQVGGFYHGAAGNSKFIWYPPNAGTMATEGYADSKAAAVINAHNTSASAHATLFAGLASESWVQSINWRAADIATNLAYTVVVSNGHWLIISQEVQ